jgi:hypothetical protein
MFQFNQITLQNAVFVSEPHFPTYTPCQTRNSEEERIASFPCPLTFVLTTWVWEVSRHGVFLYRQSLLEQIRMRGVSGGGAWPWEILIFYYIRSIVHIVFFTQVLEFLQLDSDKEISARQNLGNKSYSAVLFFVLHQAEQKTPHESCGAMVFAFKPCVSSCLDMLGSNIFFAFRAGVCFLPKPSITTAGKGNK